MPEFAKVYAEVLESRNELKTKYEKRYQPETFYLYLLICLHRWDATGICNKTIHEIIEIWELDYDNTMRRYKLLRQKGWIKIEKGRIRPLKGFVKTVKATATEDEKTVESTVKTVDSTVFDDEKTVKSTVKTVKSTVPSYKEYSEPYQNQKETEHTPELKERGAGADSNNHKSKFSMEECSTYAEICQKRGEEVRSIPGLATYCFETGLQDARIQSTLYPEPAEESGFDEPIVYEYDGNHNLIPKPLSKKLLEEALRNLVVAVCENFDLNEYQKHFTPEDWKFLMEELEQCQIAKN